MKKLFLLLLVSGLLIPEIVSSQTDQTEKEKRNAFNVTFFPRSSDSQYTNVFSFNLLVGVSKNETAFTFGGLANIIKNDATGVQFAGISNLIGNNAKGLQFGGIANIIGNNTNGLQFAGISNMVGENATGLQFAGIANIIGDNTTGLQFAGISNVIGNNGNGFLFAGLSNHTSNNYSGAQFAGLMNKSKDMKGFQFAGLANIAENVNGFQFAGLVNRAKHVKGVQFASILNIADHSDYPIGLINIIKDGEKSVGITYDETGSTLISFRSGGRILYGILGVGYNHKADDENFVMEGGFGGHIPIIDKFRINCELKTQHMSSFSDTYVSKNSLSILPAFRIIPQLEIFAGPTLNYLITDNINNENLLPSNNLWKKHGDKELKQLYIGYVAGVQYIF